MANVLGPAGCSSQPVGLSGNNTQKPLVPVDGLRGLDRAPPTSAAMPVPAALLSRSSLTAPRSLARAPLPPLSRPASPRTTAKRSWRSLSTPPTPSYPPSPPRPPPDASAPRYEGGADGRRPGPTSRPPTPPPTPKSAECEWRRRRPRGRRHDNAARSQLGPGLQEGGQAYRQRHDAEIGRDQAPKSGEATGGSWSSLRASAEPCA